MTREIMPAPVENQNSNQQNSQTSEQDQQINNNQQDTNTNPNSDIERLIQTSLSAAEQRRVEAEQRARLLEDELNQLKLQQNKPIPANTTNTELTDQRFYEKPIDTINQLIGAQVKPLVDFSLQMQQQQVYANLKNQYRSQFPAFVSIENLVDEYMSGQQPSHQNMQVAIQRAIGQLAMTGKLPGVGNNNNNQQNNNQQNNNQNQQNNNQQDPAIAGTITPKPNDMQAHLRPSQNTLSDRNNQAPKTRQLSEQERRVLREFNQGKSQPITEERYSQLLESNAKVEDWKPKGGK